MSIYVMYHAYEEIKLHQNGWKYDRKPFFLLLHLHESTFNNTRNQYVLKVNFKKSHLLDVKFVIGELLTQNIWW
jgi:hypothetical protein